MISARLNKHDGIYKVYVVGGFMNSPKEKQLCVYEVFKYLKILNKLTLRRIITSILLLLCTSAFSRAYPPKFIVYKIETSLQLEKQGLILIFSILNGF